MTHKAASHDCDGGLTLAAIERLGGLKCGSRDLCDLSKGEIAQKMSDIDGFLAYLDISTAFRHGTTY